MLDNKVAVVTGAGQGIGRALAKALAVENARVVINDIDSAKADSTAHEIIAAGGVAISNCTDISSFSGADQLVAHTVSHFGTIDIMVNNAGVLRDRMSFNMSEEEWDAVIGVCLKGTFACARSTIRALRQAGKGGRVINVSSRSGLRGAIGQANYAAAKAGVLGLTRTLCQEVVKYGITVNAIVPRAVTGMTNSVPADVKARKDATWASSSVNLRGAPEQVAPLVVYLASDEAASINGQVVGIAGDKLSLWSHPKELTEAYIFGGWSVKAIRELFKSSVGAVLETVGNKD